MSHTVHSRNIELCTKLCLVAGAKLAPFNLGGVWQSCPAKTDDALQQIFISGHYFSQKCWRAGVGGWGWCRLKIFFRALRKGSKKFFQTQTS
jgi:hypothetical protein